MRAMFLEVIRFTYSYWVHHYRCDEPLFGEYSRLNSRIGLVIGSGRHETRYRHERVKGVARKTHFFLMFLTLRKYFYPLISSIFKIYAELWPVLGVKTVP